MADEKDSVASIPPIEFKAPIKPTKDSDSKKLPTATAETETLEELTESVSKEATPSPLQHPAKIYKEPQPNASGLIDSRAIAAPRLAYSQPKWGGVCPEDSGYQLEALKAGVELPSIKLTGKSALLVGRLESCDLPMKHPSLSRHHAMLQFCPEDIEERDRGWYLFDLGSTHGTVVNKHKVPPGVFRHIRVGHVIKFGGSKRLFILQGPSDDQEEESDLTYSQIKEKKEEKIREYQARKEEKKLKATQVDTTCTWGMAEDAKDDKSDINPYADLEPLHENMYKDDPKKALRQWCDREGHQPLNFEFVEAGFGKQHCKVELPVMDEQGRAVCAEAIVSGKRREAIVACALEACGMLDKMGEFHKDSSSGRRKKTARDWEAEDYYDSDEDNFLDRTGQLEAKRAARMRRIGAKEAPKAETFDSLRAQLETVHAKILENETKLQKAAADLSDAQKATSELDELEAYMKAIQGGALDRRTRLQLKCELMNLRKEEARLTRLANKARPAHMPALEKLEVGAAAAAAAAPAAPVAPPPVAPAEEGEEVCRISVPEVTEVTEDVVQEATISSPTENETLPPPEEEVSSSSKPKPKPTSSSPTKTLPLGPSLPMDWSAPPDSTEDSPSPSPNKIPRVEEPESAAVAEAAEAAEPTPAQSSQSRRRANRRKKAAATAAQLPKDYDHNNPDISMWLPPQNQSGDGKTFLNEKLGY